jgi:hypothetical protein
VIFGNPQEFTIECVLDKRETDPDQYSFGHIAIWAGRFMLGDFLLPVLLNTPAFFFKESLNYCGQRRDEKLMAQLFRIASIPSGVPPLLQIPQIHKQPAVNSAFKGSCC